MRKRASTVSSLSFEKQEQEIREAIVVAFDEAKGNTEKAVKEAKKEIPRYREAINNYQEKTLEAAREIAESYIDSQKEILNLYQHSAWMSRLGRDDYGTFWLNWVFTVTKSVTEIYANMISGNVDSIFAATRLTNNNMISTNLETPKVALQYAAEFSKIAANNVKTFGQTVGEYTKSMSHLGSRGSSLENQIQKR